MKIRRYIGKDTHEAMKKVRVELGSDAIILNTRKIKQKGILNLFSKPLVEVLAAIDRGGQAEKESPTKNTHDKKPDVNIKPTLGETKTSTTQSNQRQLAYVDKLESRVNHIEVLIEKIYTQMNHEKSSGLEGGNYSNQLFNSVNTEKISKVIKVLSNNLLRNNVDQVIVNEMVQTIKKEMQNASTVNDVAAKMYNQIVASLGTPIPINFDEDVEKKQRIITFVGPTGVGKTTTLAKIAAISAIDKHKDIGIISADTYRIAAVEQLKTYAGILGVPVKVIYSPEEVDEAIAAFRDKDLILIDTAGRSHKDEQQFDELKNILEHAQPSEIFLLISLITDYNVCKEIVKSYDFIKDYKIIFTKMDEASSYGIILNICKDVQRQLSYITTGQSVPDDIEIINVDKIAKKLLGSIQL